MSGAFLRRSALRSSVATVVAIGGLVVTAAASAASGPPAPDLKPLVTIPTPAATPASSVLSPNGKTLYVSEGGIGNSGDSGAVYAYNVTNPGQAPTQITDGGDPVVGSTALALSPNGKTLYIANGFTSGSGSLSADPVLVADVSGSASDKADDTVVGSIAGSMADPLEAESIATSKNGKDLYIGGISTASGSSEPSFGIETASLTSATTGKVVKLFTSADFGYLVCLTLSPNGKLLYGANFGGPATVMKISGTSVSAIRPLPQVFTAYALAVSPDGRTLYSDNVDFLAIELVEGGATGAQSELDTFALGSGGTTATLKRSTITPASFIPFGLTLSAGGTTGYSAGIGFSAGTPVGEIRKFVIPAAVTKVTVSGKAKVGVKLTAKASGAGAASATFKWLAGGKAIKGATKKTLGLTAADKGKKIAVEVSAGAVGYAHATLTSKATAAVAK